tara:strand:- start:528 stop:1394 length:867 start_codon:yes stop_codon:yes gene_type:complete
MNMESSNLKMGIVGHGFVGKATDFGFNKNITKLIIDPKYNNSIRDLVVFKPEIIFVCVPTPMLSNGFQDSSIVTEVISEITDLIPETLIVIKSTITPNVIEKLKNLSRNIVYNPEFLREKHANYDFENTKILILGGEKEDCKKVASIYKNHSICKTQNFHIVDLTTASFIKYSINTFLATKVIYFNELFNLFSELGTNDSWQKVIEIISHDERLGSSHMNVPGHDGKRGFGGACFPKDSNALIKFAQSMQIDLSVLKSAVRTNNQIRTTYDDLDDREKEQNISYDGKV